MSTVSPTSTVEASHLSPAEVRRALLTAAIAWGVFGSAWMAMTSGAPYVTFVRAKLHASTFTYFLLSALPFLTVLLQWPGSYLVERMRARRLLFLLPASAGRLVWLLVAALPWVIPSHRPEVRIGLFMALMVVGAGLGSFSSPAWFSWFAEMVPEHIRGRYLSQRAALSTLTVAWVGLLVPWIIDRNSSFTAFSVLFSIAALLGLADVSLFWWVREPPMPEHEGPRWGMLSPLLTPLRDRPFRGYLLYAFSESFMFGIAGPSFMLMALEFLHLSNFRASLWVSTTPMIFTMVTLPLWGGLCDRFGARSLVALGTLTSIIYPLAYLAAAPGHYRPFLITAAVIGGVFGAAIQSGDLAMLYSLTPRAGRSAYIACVMFASSLGWFFAPTLSGALAQALKPLSWHVAGRTFGNLHVLMAISLVARLLHSAFIIPRLPEQNPRPTRELVRHLVCCPFQQLSAGFSRLADQVPFVRGSGPRGG
jgi:MFS family permease